MKYSIFKSLFNLVIIIAFLAIAVSAFFFEDDFVKGMLCLILVQGIFLEEDIKELKNG